MSQVEKRLEAMGIILPECPKPVAAYVPAMKVNGFIYASGQTPIIDGELKYKGKVGVDLTIEEGYEAAKICAIRLISEIKSVVGDLDKVKQIVKVNGYINSVGDFGRQPAVLNGASELIEAVFKEKGKHARAAIGVATLPDDAAVEVELIAYAK